MDSMKKNIPQHLNHDTVSQWSLDKILSKELYLGFLESFYKQELFSAKSDGSFNDFINIRFLLELLNTRRLSFPRCRLVSNGTLIPPMSYTLQKQGALGEKINSLDIAKVTCLMDDGATLVIDFCEDLCGSISDVCDDFSTIFSERTGATLFFNSGQKVGFTTHWDNSDVIVYQLSGKKRWKVYPKTVDMPIAENTDSMVPPLDPPLWNNTLEANEILYIPRGFWHSPEPCGEHSLHISFAFRRRNGMDYIKWLVPKLCDELVIRKDIDRNSDIISTMEFVESLKVVMSKYITENTLHSFIESCDNKPLRKSFFTERSLLKK